MIKVLIGPADKFHIDGLKIYDDESLGFDYQEHLIRRCFEENGSDANPQTPLINQHSNLEAEMVDKAPHDILFM